jgi:hypothetical protein
MPMAHIRKVGGENDLYHVHFLDAHDPGFGQGRPDRPGHDLPGGGGHPGNRPPGSGAHPGNRPPGSGGGIPDHELPDHPPPQVAPGMTLVLIRHEGRWVYAVIAPGSPPPRPLPPGEIEHPGNRPPGSSPGHPSGQPVPPTATPTGPR